MDMRKFIEGFVSGASAAMRGYFAPAVAIWKLLLTTTTELVDRKH
jgi:hypothetical protein